MGLPDRPRMTVFRSNKDIYVQLIDDHREIHLLLQHLLQLKISAAQKVTKIEKAN